jgi:uncharacterized protein (TIGR00369 family)
VTGFENVGRRAVTPSTTPAADLEGQSAFMRLLGVHFDQARGDRVAGWFEVGADHHQPWGLVHGGVFTAVIETFATAGAYEAVKDRGQLAVGVTNVTDFLRPSVRDASTWLPSRSSRAAPSSSGRS